MVNLPDSSDVRLARQVHEIRTRADLKRWEHRSKRRLRFIILSYLIGSLIAALLGLSIGLVQTIKSGDTLTFRDISAGLKGAAVGGLCCGGPLVLLPCSVLVTGGVSRYKQLIQILRQQKRVCDLCNAVALFDDESVHPSKSKGHTASDLVPHMNIFHEGEQTHVLCDACLATVDLAEQQP